LGILVISNLRK